MSRLEAEALRRALGKCTIGLEIVVLEETTSTNDAVLQMATANTREGLVLFAEHQTAGRGQRNNRWESAAHKGLWFSILLRPMIDISKSARLTAWAAEIVAKTILQELALAATIKLPNGVCVEEKNIARRSGRSTSALRRNFRLIILQSAQFLQRAAAVDLLTCQGNPVIQIAGQSGDHKSTRGVDHDQVALRSGYFRSQNPFQAGGIFLAAAPAQLCGGASRDPKPVCIENGRSDFAVAQLRDGGWATN